MIYKLITRVIQYFCFPERPMKGGDIMDFLKEEESQKRGVGVDLEKVEYDPPYQLCSQPPLKLLLLWATLCSVGKSWKLTLGQLIFAQ